MGKHGLESLKRVEEVEKAAHYVCKVASAENIRGYKKACLTCMN